MVLEPRVRRLALLMLLACAGWAHAADADATWGIYARLVGTVKQAGPSGYQLRWRWEVPDEVLVQEWVEPRTGKVAYTNTIMPGVSPGTLRVKGSYLGGKEWDGTVEPDGSVVFIGRGLLKAPHRVVLTVNDTYEIRRVQLRARQVVSESPAQNLSRFAPVDATGGAMPGDAPAAPVGAGAAAIVAAQPAPVPAQPEKPRTAEELEAEAIALQEQAAALRRAQADAAEQEVASAAQAEIARLEQLARDAGAAADAAKREAEEAQALAQAADPPKPKPRPWVKGADNRDWWSYCAYGVHGGDSFITQLINQRIYHPYEGPRDEYDAYDGPNRDDDVEERFIRAMQTSGLVPQQGGYIGVNCKTFGSRDSADYYYRQAQQQDPAPRRVLWLRLEDEQIVGSRNLPTLEELAAMKRAAEEASRRAEAARAAAADAARLEAARQKSRKLKKDCEAGVPGSCVASKQ